MNDKKRYQDQPWYIRLWRRRYYIPIPWKAFKMWVGSKERFGLCWSLAVGMAQADMSWYYTWEEVKERLEKKIR